MTKSKRCTLTRNEKETAERSAGECLRKSGFEWAPATAIAAALGFHVDSRGLLGFEGATIKGSRTLRVSPAYGPKEQFVAGHELGHHFAPDDLRPEALEAWCDRFSAALLLPSTPFLSSCGEHCFNLSALRQRWPWASWAVIAFRVSDLCPSTAGATWLHGNIDERHSFYPNTPLSQAEKAAVSDVRARGGRSMVIVGETLALAWYVPRGRADWVYSLALPTR